MKNKWKEIIPTTKSIFPGGSEVKASASNVGDQGLIPGSGRSTGEGNGNPLQYSCLENPMDGGAWWATVHGVAKSRIRLSNFTFHFPLFIHRKALILLTWDVWFSLNNSNYLLFQLPGLCCKNSYIYWPLHLLLPLCVFGVVPQSNLRFLSPSLEVLRMSTKKNGYLSTFRSHICFFSRWELLLVPRALYLFHQMTWRAQAEAAHPVQAR